MALNPFLPNPSHRIMNDYLARHGVNFNDDRNEISKWLHREHASFTPEALLVFLSQYRIAIPLFPWAPTKKLRGNKPLTVKTAVFLRRLIYVYVHDSSTQLSKEQRSHFNDVRRNVLGRFIKLERAILKPVVPPVADVENLVRELKKKRSTQRWGHIVDFIFRYQVGASEVCEIRNSDLNKVGERYVIDINGHRTGRRKISVPVSYLDPIIKCFGGENFLFETQRSTNGTRRGGMPFDRTSLTNAIKRNSLAILGQAFSARDFQFAKKNAQARMDIPDSGQTLTTLS